MAAALFCSDWIYSAHAAGKFLCPVAIAARVRGPRHRPLFLFSAHAAGKLLCPICGGLRHTPLSCGSFWRIAHAAALLLRPCATHLHMLPASIFVLWLFLPRYFFPRALRVAGVCRPATRSPRGEATDETQKATKRRRHRKKRKTTQEKHLLPAASLSSKSCAVKTHSERFEPTRLEINGSVGRCLIDSARGT